MSETNAQRADKLLSELSKKRSFDRDDVAYVAAALEAAELRGAGRMAAYIYYRAQEENDSIWMLRSQTDIRAILAGVVDGVDFIKAMNEKRAAIVAAMEREP